MCMCVCVCHSVSVYIAAQPHTHTHKHTESGGREILQTRKNVALGKNSVKRSHTSDYLVHDGVGFAVAIVFCFVAITHTIRYRKEARWLTPELLPLSSPKKQCLVQLHSVKNTCDGITNEKSIIKIVGN